MKIFVYHGGTDCVEKPLCHIGRPNLDFGQGFYLTEMKEQAISWAKFLAGRRERTPIVNIYQLDKSAILAEARCKIFKEYDEEWLNFIARSRKGLNPAADYDYIEGGIANDRVIDTINLYIAGLMSIEVALNRLAQHRPNNQICLLNQDLTDKFLIYERSEHVE
ncbi:MAG: DUF3990 domain-containing protein [Bacteroidales bacterium]|nr:DUF3990 domain-containing protein [Bacteroidales bacterium]